MDTTTLLFLASTLICPIAMGGMMWLMMKQMQQEPQQPPATAAERLAALHAQQAALETEIAAARRLAEREMQEDSPAPRPSSTGNLDVALPTSKV